MSSMSDERGIKMATAPGVSSGHRLPPFSSARASILRAFILLGHIIEAA